MKKNIENIKDKILQLAISGNLVEQDPEDESAEIFYKKTQEKKEILIKEKKVKSRRYDDIKNEDIPHKIPLNWKWVRFNEIFDFQIGKTPTRGNKSYWEPDKYPWVTISDMTDGEIINDTKEKVSEKGYSKFNQGISKKDTLLMSFKLTIGRMAILGMDSFHNEAIISICPFLDKENILRDYFYKIGGSLNLLQDTKSAVMGKTLNSTSIGNILIPLPPLNEQKRIIQKVDELFLLIDRIIDFKDDTINVLDLLEEKILDKAIKGELVEQHLEDESADILYEKIQEEKEVLIKNKDIRRENLINIKKEDIPFKIPLNWKWVRLGSISSVKGGKRIPKGKSYSDKKTQYPYLRVTNMKQKTVIDNDMRYIDSKVYNQIKNYTITTEDIYITIAGTIGDVGVIPKKYNNINLTENAAKIVLYESEYIDQKYLLYVLQTSMIQDAFTEMVNQLAQPKLSLRSIKKSIIPLPPLKEQKKIVKKLDEIMDHLEKIRIEIS